MSDNYAQPEELNNSTAAYYGSTSSKTGDTDTQQPAPKINGKAETLPRAKAQALDDILGKIHKVSDEGFVRVVDYMGNDQSIVQSARISYGAGTKNSRDDRNLIRYLMRNRHTSPFEMCEVKLHIKIPIFVARQWIRHRTANVNEYSARYSVVDSSFHIPADADLCPQSNLNIQQRDEGKPLDKEIAKKIIAKIKNHSNDSYKLYQQLISDDDVSPAIARELARMVLPLNTMTELYWKIDLHNLLHFLSLRLDKYSQPEIRIFAETIASIVKKWVPITFESFEEYMANGKYLSRSASKLIKDAIDPSKIKKPEDMSKSEWKSLQSYLYDEAK